MQKPLSPRALPGLDALRGFNGTCAGDLNADHATDLVLTGDFVAGARACFSPMGRLDAAFSLQNSPGVAVLLNRSR